MKARLPVAVTLIALAAIACAAVVVLAFGRNNPSPPSLEDEPIAAIPGEILFVDDEDCVVRAAASGETTEQVYCGPPPSASDSYIYTWSWLEDGRIAALVSSRSAPGFDVYAVDLETGRDEFLGTTTSATDPFGPNQPAPDGTVATIQEDKLVLTRGGDRTEIAEFDFSSNAWARVAGWSPDSEWIAVLYQPPRGSAEQELWIISRDGKTQGTLSDEVRGSWISWRIEGAGIWPQLEVRE